MSSFNHRRNLQFPNLQYGIFSLPLLLLIFLVLCPNFPATRAQPQQPPPPPPPASQYPYAKFSPSMAIIIVILISALFLMGFFSIYIRHCSQPSAAGNSIRNTFSTRRRAAASRGLDPDVIETFPTFTYAQVKDHKIGKGALECAVCINEFEDDETLRLIPKCDHVFHPQCIDAWLESHVTCPVCRSNLSPDPAAGEEPPSPPAPAPAPAAPSERNDQAEANSDGVTVQVEYDESKREDEETCTRPEAGNRNLSRSGSLNRPPRSWSIKRPRMFGRFRSHSTGHSVVLPGENLDRFTLRLPEEMRKEMMNRAVMNRTGSCVERLPREGSSGRGYRTGGDDGSNRGVRFYRRIDASDRAVKSDRWAFLTRALSLKSLKPANDGDGSTSKSPRAVVKMPSIKCLEPKSGDETGLIRSDSARLPV